MTAIRALKRFAKSTIDSIPILNRRILVSAGYRMLSRAQAEAALAQASGWHSPRSAKWQERAFQALLADLRAGHPRRDLAVAAEAIIATGLQHPSLLEVGCGNGYYSEAFSILTPSGLDYTGIDYSKAMVESAQKRYPGAKFLKGDATALGFPTAAFDIVFNGVSLMHIMNYAAAVREAARTARSYVVFHCVPVLPDRETVYLSKYAYGERVIEIAFGEAELLALFASSGLVVERTWDVIEYDLSGIVGSHSRNITYLCRKISADDSNQ